MHGTNMKKEKQIYGGVTITSDVQEAPSEDVFYVNFLVPELFFLILAHPVYKM